MKFKRTAKNNKKAFSKPLRKSRLLTNAIVSEREIRKGTFIEKVIKFVIYLALRLVIRPSKWRETENNYEIIDRTYARILSADFIYIPSSIAFHIIMAFMPMLFFVTFIESLDFLSDFLQIDGKNALEVVLGRFIPGIAQVLQQISGATTGSSGIAAQVSSWIAIVLSLFSSIWIAASGFAKLVYTESYIYNHRFVGGYFMNRLRGIVMVLLFTLYLLVAISISVLFEQGILLLNLSAGISDGLRYMFLIVTIFGFSFLAFGMLYRYSPRFKTQWKWIIPGTMACTIPTSLFLVTFGFIANYINYDKYGAVGVFMYLGISSLLITYFVFIGILINAGFHKTFIGHVQRKYTFSKK